MAHYNQNCYFYPQASFQSAQSANYMNYYVHQQQHHHDSFSSGYESIDSSFNTSPVLNRVLNNATNSTQQSDARKAPKKRKREADDNQTASSKVDLIINQVFDQEIKMHKKQKKQQENLENLEPENDELDEDFDASCYGKKKRVLTREQRLAANVRERKRMHIMNDAFVKLKQVLPQTTGRKRRKMSRLDIVLSATEYIAYLDMILQSGQPQEINFESYLNSIDFNFLNNAE